MNYPTALLSHPLAVGTRPRLGRTAAFGLLASAALTLLASSSVPTPLYATYQAKWGFSDLTVTVIFGVYAVAVLASLLVFGSLSDHIGRRPLLIAGLGSQVLVMMLFAFAGNLDVLLAARVLQGLATGAALGAIGAGLVDLHPNPRSGRERFGADGRNSQRLPSLGAVRAVPAGTD